MRIEETLWLELGDIPVNENEEIDQNWNQFKRGHCIYDIWHWFEDSFNCSIVDLREIH